MACNQMVCVQPSMRNNVDNAAVKQANVKAWFWWPGAMAFSLVAGGVLTYNPGLFLTCLDC